MDLKSALAAIVGPEHVDPAGDRHLQDITENPPSTGIAAPVTKSDAGEARNTAMPAKSSISPQRAKSGSGRTRRRTCTGVTLPLPGEG